MVQALYLDEANQILWAGTVGGLSKLDISSMQWKSYDRRSGMVNETITGIVPDDNGSLWISTGNGLSRFDPRTETFHNFDVRDGLQGSQFNMGSFHRASDGELFFGGPNGLTGFYPDQIENNPYQPPVILSNFLVSNLTVSAGTKILPSTIEQTKAITLDYSQSVFTIEFSALNYQITSKNLYQYKMINFDQDWSPPSDRRSATYTNLNPGQYTFQVRAANNDGTWNETPCTLTINILPPWWRTNWFQLLAISLVVAVIFTGVQLRLRSVQTRANELENRVQERTLELSSSNQKLQHEVLQRQQAEERLQEQLNEISALRDLLREQAMRDALTGLYNRRYLEEMLTREVARAEREHEKIGILMLDIDYFKNFNDTYSHRAGDELLRAMGQMLQAKTRRSDITCRYGGEEFIIILPDAGAEDCRQRAEEIRQMFKELTIDYQGQTLSTTISIGVAVYPDHGLTGDNVLAGADQALYQAKRTGRDRVVVYSKPSPDGQG